MSLEDELVDFKVIKRFMNYIDMRDDDECWPWLGGLTNGRGMFSYQGKNEYAYRISYLINKGPIPNGKLVMHSCDNGNCINPKHLKLGTHKDNSDDKIAKGRAYFQNKFMCT